jgi:signal transduction histidine kinase/ActR/RegA family two-component response regulator
MKRRFDERQREELRQSIIGLGERSLRKSYYPELQKQIRELEKTNIELQKEILERKKAEEFNRKLESQLRRSQKLEAIGSLAGGIAHDFNNILSAIIGFTELAGIHIAKCDLTDHCSVKKDLDGILRSADRAKQLVLQILSFSRQQEGVLRQVSLDDLIRETVKMLRALIPTTIAITYTTEVRDTTVLADPIQFHQVLMNLGTNAYHAMQSTGGTLTFELGETVISSEDWYFSTLQLSPGPYLTLRVSDTGQGMDKETLEKIFDPYFTTRREEGGTGLGLSVVHRIISLHKGCIFVYSEPGQGTIFHIYLPQSRLSDETTGSHPEPEAEALRGHERLLVVDDETILLEVMQRLLEDLGYTVTICPSSKTAVELFEHDPTAYDLVVTDMNMPEMNGMALIGRIRTLRPGIPVILCTGFSELMNAETTKALGRASYLMKPVMRGELSRTIRRLLEGEGKDDTGSLVQIDL